MERNSEPGTEVRAGEASSGVVLLGRLMWMVLGPMLLLVITYAIVTSEGWFTISDAAFAVVIGLMLGGRSIEQRSGTAMTATGEPATIEHFERYVKILLPVAAVVWVVANVMGNLILV